MAQAETGKKTGEEAQKGKKGQKRVYPSIDRDYLYYAGAKYLERYAASREQFRNVLYRKIMRSCRDHPDQDEAHCRALADEIVEEFTQAGHLDDERYTQGMVASYRRKGESRGKIRQRLMHKGVGREMIEAELGNYDESLADNAGCGDDMQDDTAELCAAIRFAQRKRLGPFANDPEKPVEQRHYAKLARAGFSYHIAREALHMNRDDALGKLQAFD